MANDRPVTFGIDTFGDVTVDLEGRRLSDAEVLRNVVEEAVLAERVGLDHVSIGEHHRGRLRGRPRRDMVLAAIASRTERVTLRHGGHRAQLRRPGPRLRAVRHLGRPLQRSRRGRRSGAGRSPSRSPLFGYDLADYEVLFAEKLDLFARLRSEQPVSWEGSTRRPLVEADVHPQDRARHDPHLDRRRRLPRVGRPRREVRPAAHAGDHRR